MPECLLRFSSSLPPVVSPIADRTAAPGNRTPDTPCAVRALRAALCSYASAKQVLEYLRQYCLDVYGLTVERVGCFAEIPVECLRFFQRQTAVLVRVRLQVLKRAVFIDRHVQRFTAARDRVGGCGTGA